MLRSALSILLPVKSDWKKVACLTEKRRERSLRKITKRNQRLRKTKRMLKKTTMNWLLLEARLH